jgi:hypothetical protein
MNRQTFRLSQWFRVAIIAVTSLLALILIVLSPVALVQLGYLSKNWSQLSNIGQTYGAISALISSLALGGVVVSLIFQARDLRTARNQNIRDFQHRLIRMEMEDPTLMTALGAPWNLAIPAESEKIRQYLYIHMWASYWAGNYSLGELTDSEVKFVAINELFRGKAGREYWASIRSNVLTHSKGKYYRFAQIIDAAYNEAISSNIPINTPVKVTGRANDDVSLKRKSKYFLTIGTTLIAGILAGRKFNRRSN